MRTNPAKTALLGLTAALALACTPSCSRPAEPTGLAADYLLLGSVLFQDLRPPRDTPAATTRDGALALLSTRADRLRSAGPLDPWVEEIRLEAIEVCQRSIELLARPGPLDDSQRAALAVLTGVPVHPPPEPTESAAPPSGAATSSASPPADAPDEWTALARRFDTLQVRLAPIADRIDPDRQRPLEIDLAVSSEGGDLRLALTNRTGRALPPLTAAVQAITPAMAETARTFHAGAWPDGETRIAHLRRRPWEPAAPADADSVDVRLSAHTLRSTPVRAIRPASGWPESP